jgi:soluble lytic murein transglycosylase-like protein
MNTTLPAEPSPVVGIAAASGAPSPFRLITEKTRKEFFDPNFLDPLAAELVQEKFFRDEVPYGSLIYSEAKKHSLQPELLAAVVKAESDFRPGITSPRNALGLMQIVPSTGELMGATDLLDPADNVRTGAKYLRYLHDRFDGDQSMTLAAYNAGEGAVRRFGGVPPYKETRAYLRKVTDAKQEYHRRVAFRLMQHRTEIDAMTQAH